MSQELSAPEKKMTTRSRIVQAYLDGVANAGAVELTAGRLSSSLGISKSTLFHHFPCMEDLEKKAFHSFCEQFATEWLRMEADSAAELFTKLGPLLVEQVNTTPQMHHIFMHFFTRALHSPVLKASMQDLLRRTQEPLAERLRQFGYDPKRSRDLALLCLVLLDGFGLYALMLGKSEDLTQAWEEWSRIFPPPDFEVKIQH